MIIFPVSPSRDAVGSSRIRISGLPTIARAMATLCCSPPDSFTGRISERPFSPTISRYFFASAIDSSRSRCLRMRRIATFSAVVRRGKEMKILEYEADGVQPEVGQLVGAEGQISAPLTVTMPEFGLRMPEIMLSSVVLPLPDGPTMNSISPVSRAPGRMWIEWRSADSRPLGPIYMCGGRHIPGSRPDSRSSRCVDGCRDLSELSDVSDADVWRLIPVADRHPRRLWVTARSARAG